MMAFVIFIVIQSGSLRYVAVTVGFYVELVAWEYKATVKEASCHNVPILGVDMAVLGMSSSIELDRAETAAFSGREASIPARPLKSPWVNDVIHVMMDVVKDIFGQYAALRGVG
jgi:hypothetical protein